MAGEVLPATLQLGHAGLHRRQPEHRGGREPLGGQRPEEQNRRVRCNDAGVSPVPEVRWAAGLYVDDGSTAPESLAHSIDKVTLHGAAQFDLHGNGWEVPEFFTGITWAAMAASGDGTHSTAGYLLMTFPELMAPGGIRGDGPAKGGLGRLFNTLVTVHGYKDGELDSVDDGEIAAAWMETAHALVPPLEFEVCFANAASRAREFTMRLRILEARSPHGNPTAADKMEGEPTMLSRVCQIGGCAPYLVRTVGSCSPATFVECLATLGAAMDPNYAGRPASLQMLRGVERWLKEHHATTLDELDVMRGQGKQIDRDASVQAVVKAATDGREFQRAAQATKASATSGSEERGDAYSRVMALVPHLPRVRAARGRRRPRHHPVHAPMALGGGATHLRSPQRGALRRAAPASGPRRHLERAHDQRAPLHRHRRGRPGGSPPARPARHAPRRV